ncbi:MAG: polyribonucleotide nucleotidyltransferase [Rickettsiales bacterium]|nr:polyribonucleotide nucleotidyltransferase [Rickettsiales bacterium]MCA0254250.1 polyribonucleotide nucleotidyltransferase [Pseudomonadota bacterium]
MFNEIKKQIEWNGSSLELSTGKIARQADGAVMVRMGDTIVQCTTVTAKSVNEGMNFFPLTVNYQEKLHAAGRIPGGFFKREGKGSEKEILVSRLIDRPIRPLFHPGFFNETQILCTVHSFDPAHNPDILALIGASAALAISGVPYQDIVAASRVGFIDDQFVLNPNFEQLNDSKLDLVVAGTKDSVMMVESEADFLTEEIMLEAVKFGHKSFAPVIKLIEELKAAVGKPAWEAKDLFPASLKEAIAKETKEEIKSAFAIKVKQDRYAAIDAIKERMLEKFTADESFTTMQVDFALSEVKSDVLRTDTLEKKIRIDGRALDEIRPIESEVSLFPGAHGSALFTRGETQAIVTATLGTGQDEQIMDGIEGEYKENFLLNYLFPPYSVGEAAPLRAPSRREIGHGKLAWRALKRAIPSKSDFPYTIRVVSEISESNGSSSMATVCGGSMSMMDAGVPLKSAISGIAMGLIKEGNKFVVLSDIIADEDHLGDMDFKVAGSRDGVTALQMDIKVAGITFEIMEQALGQAKSGRVHILDKMSKAISTNSSISDNAPIVESFTIPKDKIREVIGAGGKVIREICDTTGAKIDITDEGQVSVAAVGREKLEAAVRKVKEIAIDPEIGDVFEGTVVKILDAGAFVNYLGNRDGFVHISEIANERIESVASALSEGQKVKVKLIGYDRGKAKLTIKNADKEVTAEPNELKTEPKKEKPEKRENKKWKNKSPESNSPVEIKERKYFN